MVEPTETETRETLDAFAEAIAEILREAAEDPEIARNAPYSTPVRRLDEAAPPSARSSASRCRAAAAVSASGAPPRPGCHASISSSLALVVEVDDHDLVEVGAEEVRGRRRPSRPASPRSRRPATFASAVHVPRRPAAECSAKRGSRRRSQRLDALPHRPDVELAVAEIDLVPLMRGDAVGLRSVAQRAERECASSKRPPGHARRELRRRPPSNDPRPAGHVPDPICRSREVGQHRQHAPVVGLARRRGRACRRSARCASRRRRG